MKSIKEEQLEQPAFTLPNETVVVKFIKRKQGLAANVDDNHVISGGMLNNAKKKFSAPLQRNGAVANVLTAAEKKTLEALTGLDLSVYGEFWQTFSVPLFKADANNILNLRDPMDYIKYKILLSLKSEIAPSWQDRNKKATYQFAITGSNEEFDEKKAKFDITKEAWKQYARIENNREKLVGILRLQEKTPISPDSDLSWLQGKVEENLDKNPKAFLDIASDPSFDTKMLINKAVDAKYIVRNGNKYETIDGLELAEQGQMPTFDNAVSFLDNPKNQEIRSLLEARLNKKK